MAGLPEVIGLLHRADWTRLSLSAEVRFEQDGDLARRRENAVRTESMRRMGFRPGSPGMPDVEQEPDAERDVYHRWRAALLIAPGRRYRLEYEGEHGSQADGSDGEQGWTLRPPDAAPLPPRDFEGGPGLPVPALFGPAGLLARVHPGREWPGHRLRPRGDRCDGQAAMPRPEPGPLDPGDGPLPSDDLLGLLYRSGLYDGDEPQVRDAAVRRWTDTAPSLAQVAAPARAAGLGGVGYLYDAMAQKGTVTLTAGRLRVGGPDLYYLDYSSWQGRPEPIVIACDGEQHWQVRENVTLVGPARPMTGEFASMVGSSWLLGERLSGGAEITYHGRRGYHLRVTRGEGARPGGPSSFYPADAIVDAETGCLLRLIAYDGDAPAPATWWELDDVSAEPGGTADPAGFRPRIPPGTRVLEESGNPMVDVTAVWPGLTGTAARAAAEAFRRGTNAVSAARSFLDDLRGDRR